MEEKKNSGVQLSSRPLAHPPVRTAQQLWRVFIVGCCAGTWPRWRPISSRVPEAGSGTSKSSSSSTRLLVAAAQADGEAAPVAAPLPSSAQRHGWHLRRPAFVSSPTRDAASCSSPGHKAPCTDGQLLPCPAMSSPVPSTLPSSALYGVLCGASVDTYACCTTSPTWRLHSTCSHAFHATHSTPRTARDSRPCPPRLVVGSATHLPRAAGAAWLH
ncbi:hypothetical protein CDD82_6560 [Ophiocordyceps australis]|uniref:Uncharacterized protein n=1 Tax=Ophiocordyceps australis TaxID=1399860 RepID=A0A2C5ZSB4_9HYPO|nr:hypothetical protein CDD82_6560 [Ophiocordyceps australis]